MVLPDCSESLFLFPAGTNIFSAIGMLSGPLILITAIAPPFPVAGAHIVSPFLIINFPDLPQIYETYPN
jgi:hypothetical protein